MGLNNIGTAYLTKGQYEDALTYYQQALQLRQKLNVADDVAETLRNLAVTDTKLGQYDPALAQYLKALELWRNSGDRRGTAMVSYDMGGVFIYQGRYGAAFTARQEALNTFRAVKDRTDWMVEALSGYSEALALVGRGDEAGPSFEEGLGLARELKNESLVSQVERYQGDAAGYRGDAKSARTLYDQALQTASSAKDAEKILLARLALAHNDVQQGHAAAAALRGLGQQAESQGLKYESVQAALDLAETLISAKSLPQAHRVGKGADTLRKAWAAFVTSAGGVPAGHRLPSERE
jgi:tetratricopeptide (TPR) repeat protein